MVKPTRTGLNKCGNEVANLNSKKIMNRIGKTAKSQFIQSEMYVPACETKKNRSQKKLEFNKARNAYNNLDAQNVNLCNEMLTFWRVFFRF